MATLKTLLLVMAGGALGSLARYALARLINVQPWATGFPFGTLVVNVTGSFVLGIIGGLFVGRPEREDWLLFLGTGFCGGYTTFSTFEWETLELIRNDRWGLACANVLGSVVVGFLGVLLGFRLAQLFVARP